MKRLGLMASALFVLIGCCWALASPVGSSPDDDFHLSSIWCAWGDRQGACTIESADPLMVTVPARVVNSSACFNFRPDIGGSCTEKITTGDASGITWVNDNLYPQPYYKVAGLFVGPDVKTSVIVIRIFNVLLAAALLLGILVLAPLVKRRSFLLAFAVLSVPLGIFVIASTNPSSWTFTGAATYWLYLWLWMDGVGVRSARRTTLIGLGLALSAAMLVGARTDGALLAVFETMAVAVVYGPTLAARKGSRGLSVVRLLPAAIVILAAAVVALTSSQLSANSKGMQGIAAAQANRAPMSVLVSNLMEFPSLLLGSLGSWKLGWLDTAMPTLTLFVGALSLGALVFIGLSDMWSRKGVALLVLSLPLVIFPLVVLQRGGNLVGEGVQPRYLLPALVAFMCFLLLTRAEALPWTLTRAHGVVFVVAMSASSVVAFAANVHRYQNEDPFSPRTWSMLPFTTPAVLIAVVSLAYVGWYLVVARAVVHQDAEPGVPCSTA